jgi:N-acetylmuramoyl-L-alanine amidase
MSQGGHRPVQHNKKSIWRSALRLLSVFIPVGMAHADPQTGAPLAAVPLALSVRQDVAEHQTRLIFALGACVTADAHVLENPARAIVDTPEVNFQIDPQVGRKPAERGRRRAHRAAPAVASPEGGLIASYRFGRLSPGKSRIVVDLTGPAEIATQCAPAPDGSFELILSLTPQNDAAFRTAARAGAEIQTLRTSQLTPAPPPSPQPANPAGEKPLVVIDPGHGGVDTGALGRDHAVEKLLVLEFAKVLGAKLRETDHFRVVFTREDDSFVPLGERVKLARRLGAGLFVSLHADALARDADVQGATVYTVSDRASDAEAARVAEHENKADAAAGVDAKEDASDVNDILFDLTRRETRAYSHVFGHSLAEYWKVAARLNKNPSRSAGFVVLKAPDVPSVLLELGYLSNDSDAADLSSPEWRQKAAAQVARAVEGFFAAHPSERPPKAQGAQDAPGAPNGAALKATQSNGN